VTEVKFLGERAGAPPGLVHVSTIFVDVTVNQNDQSLVGFDDGFTVLDD
jgi:hypothetical protein